MIWKSYWEGHNKEAQQSNFQNVELLLFYNMYGFCIIIFYNNNIPPKYKKLNAT